MAGCFGSNCGGGGKATRRVKILHTQAEAAEYNYCDTCIAVNMDYWKTNNLWGGVRDLEEKPAVHPQTVDDMIKEWEKGKNSIYQEPPASYVDWGIVERMDKILQCPTCDGKGTIRKPLFNTMYDEPCGDCSG